MSAQGREQPAKQAIAMQSLQIPVHLKPCKIHTLRICFATIITYCVLSAQFSRHPAANGAGQKSCLSGSERREGEKLSSAARYAGTHSQPTKWLWPVLSIRWMAIPIADGNSFDVIGKSLRQAGALFIGGFRNSRWQYAPPGEAQWQKLLPDGRIDRYRLRHSPGD